MRSYFLLLYIKLMCLSFLFGLIALSKIIKDQLHNQNRTHCVFGNSVKLLTDTDVFPE